MVAKENWGLKKLAYPIQNKKSGFYHLFEFNAPAEIITEFELEFRRDERVMRYLTVKLDKHAVAWTIEKTQRPTLILAPNKSLAAQLAQEMMEFFPDNRVEYFVSYYDYYQPEAYIASSDTFIEKDSSINDDIDRLRHSATAALLTRRDTIVVASVSCIYGMGDPDEYRGQLLELHTNVDYDMRSILRRLVDLQYDRNDMSLGRGKFRVRGDTIEIHPAYEESVLRVEMFGDTCWVLN